MSIVTNEELAEEAGVDPWTLTGQFTAGSPGEIEALATGFAKAAGGQQLTSTLNRHATALTKDGYQVDGKTPVDVAFEVSVTDKDMGDRGSKVRQIAKILDATAEDLATRTTTATGAMSTLEADLQGQVDAFNTFMQGIGHHLPPEDQLDARNDYIQKMVGLVRNAGGPIQRSVEAYETALSGHLKSMADLGYVPPDALDEGPGDAGFSPKAGADDGKTVDTTLGKPPSQVGINTISGAEQKVQLLNAKLKAGGTLTAEEQAYLDSFYNSVGPDGLSKLRSYVDSAAADYPRSGPGGSNLGTQEDLRSKVLTPLADGVMNLSDPNKNYDHNAHVPKAITDLENTPIGNRQPDTGALWAKPWGSNGAYGRYDDGLTIDGLAKYDGFADLMGSADINGGTDFTKSLGESAIRVKQNLNQIAGSETSLLRSPGAGPVIGRDVHLTPQDVLNMIKGATNDDGPGELLSLVGKNGDASNAMLLDNHDRQAVLGMNWGDGAQGGAASIVTAGTRPDVDPAHKHNQAAAALAVMTDLGNNPTAYHAHVTKAVDGAVLNMAKNYMGSFAQPADPNNPTSSVNDSLQDPFGGTSTAPVLSDSDKQHFLEYLMSGDGNSVKFHGAADQYAQDELTHALQTKDSGVIDKVMQQTGALDGSITKADYHAQLNIVQANDDQKTAAYQAALHRSQGEQFLEGLVKTGITVGVGAATDGAGIPAAISLASPIVDQVFKDATSPGAVPTAQLPTSQAQLEDQNSQQYLLHRDYNIAVAEQRNGMHLDPSLVGSDGRVIDYGQVGAKGHTDQLTDLQSDVNSLDQSGGYRTTYNENFGSYSNGSYYNDLGNSKASANDPWHTGAGAQSMLYGTNTDLNPGTRTPIYPDDPAKLWQTENH